MSAAGLKEEVELARKELREEHLGRGEDSGIICLTIWGRGCGRNGTRTPGKE